MRKHHFRTQTVIVVPGGRVFTMSLVFSIILLILIFVVGLDYGFLDRHQFFSRALGGVIGGLIAWKLFVSTNTVEKVELKQITQVAPGLWRGGLLYSNFDFDDYPMLDIVVDLRSDSERPNQNVLVPHGKKYMRWPFEDRQLPDNRELCSLTSYLAEKCLYNQVGIFCTMGINRSGLVAGEIAKKLSQRSDQGTRDMSDAMFNENFKNQLDSI